MITALTIAISIILIPLGVLLSAIIGSKESTLVQVIIRSVAAFIVFVATLTVATYMFPFDVGTEVVYDNKVGTIDSVYYLVNGELINMINAEKR